MSVQQFPEYGKAVNMSARAFMLHPSAPCHESQAPFTVVRDVTTGHYSMLEDSPSSHRGSMWRHCDVTAGYCPNLLC